MFRPVSAHSQPEAVGKEEHPAGSARPEAGAGSAQRSDVRFAGLQRRRLSGAGALAAQTPSVAGADGGLHQRQEADYHDPHGIFTGMRQVTMAAALEHDAQLRAHQASAVLGRQTWTPGGIRQTASLTRDPETSRLIPKSTLAGRQKVVDPETGETVSKTALAGRQKVVDPETGETVSKTALAKRQKMVDPETGEMVSKTALAKRQRRRRDRTGRDNG